MSILDRYPFEANDPKSREMLAALANAYPTLPEIREPLAVAGIPRHEIAWHGSAANVWLDVCERAANSGQLRQLIEVVAAAPNAQAYQIFRELVSTPIESVPRRKRPVTPARRPGAWPLAVLGTVAALVLAGAVGIGIRAFVKSLNDAGASVDGHPALTVTVKTVSGGWCSTVVFPKAVTELSSLPAPDPTAFGTWVRANGGSEANPYGAFRLGRVQLNLSGAGSKPVTITDLTAEVVDRQPGPLKGTTVSGQCGSETIGRLAEIDLDANPPTIIGSSADPAQIWGHKMRTTPLEFPYKITDSDTELLMIIGEVPSTDTVFYRLHVGWSDGTRSGSETIDNNGQPFRTATADPANPMYKPTPGGLVRAG
ncbi:effector-associated domain EAD1-containing protein [Nocardia sp. NPDC056611]|uniref:effector-associated domain EAD1-containing protein n=1 Tax=Nocardia sp. NPDC056611 TaxID=3345877 RepID=UPI00366F7450